MHRDGWSRVKKPLNFKIAPWLSWLERLLDMERVTGSNPVGATIIYILLYYNWQIDMLEVHDRVSSNLTRRTILSVAVVVRSPMSSHITECTNYGSCPCRICDEGIAVRYHRQMAQLSIVDLAADCKSANGGSTPSWVSIHKPK